MTARWSPGDTVVVRNLARSDGGVTSAIPTLVVRDDDAVLALFTPAGVVMMDNYVVAADQRVAAVGTAPPARQRPHVERTWNANTLRLYLPDTAFSVWLFFDPAGAPAGWYGNLEAPYGRTPIGIDTQDHSLDVVADVAGRWRWKDEAEFARRLELGLDSAEHQASVRAAGRSFIARLEQRATPFDQGWETWRPPADWAIPRLPPDWKADFGAIDG